MGKTQVFVILSYFFGCMILKKVNFFKKFENFKNMSTFYFQKFWNVATFRKNWNLGKFWTFWCASYPPNFFVGHYKWCACVKSAHHLQKSRKNGHHLRLASYWLDSTRAFPGSTEVLAGSRAAVRPLSGMTLKQAPQFLYTNNLCICQILFLPSLYTKLWHLDLRIMTGLKPLARGVGGLTLPGET